MNHLIIYLAIHLICGALAYGITLAHVSTWTFKKVEPRNIQFSSIVGALGPIGLVIALVCSDWGKRGLRFW